MKFKRGLWYAVFKGLSAVDEHDGDFLPELRLPLLLVFQVSPDQLERVAPGCGQ
jgi:hypothetical protein